MTRLQLIGGLAVLAIYVAPCAYAARRLRRWLAPTMAPEVATLSTVVLFLSIFLGVAQVVGTFGGFRPWPLGLAYVLVGVASTRVPSGEHPSTPSDGSRPSTRSERWRPTLGGALAAVAIGGLATIWFDRTYAALLRGTLGYDSLSYHLPWAARFVERASVIHINYVLDGYSTNFDPANNSLLHAIGMVATQRDVLSPLLSWGWLALLLFATWTFEERRGRRALTLVAVMAVTATPLVVASQAATALSDLAPVALLASALAILRRTDGGQGPVFIAGLAAGLALSTKLSVAVPILVLTVALPWVFSTQRWPTLRAWIGGLALTGTFWFLRNLFAIGNPLPHLELGIGPLRFPRPRFSVNDGDHFTVGSYIGDRHVVVDVIAPAFQEAFGRLWIALFLGLLGVLVLAVVKGQAMDRALAACAVLAALGYAATPGTALGPEGDPLPLLLTLNARILLPALFIASLMAGGLVTRVLRTPATVAIAALVFVELGADNRFDLNLRTLSWPAPSFAVGGLVAVGMLALSIRPEVLRGWRVGATASLLGLGTVLVLLHTLPTGVQHRFAGHYGRATVAYEWVRDKSNLRIATAGVERIYPLYGATLSNHVQGVGHRGPHGEFEASTSCEEWLTNLAAGDYDFVVVGPHDELQPGPPIERAWTLADPGARLVVERDLTSVIELTRTPDPASCEPAEEGGR